MVVRLTMPDGWSTAVGLHRGDLMLTQSLERDFAPAGERRITVVHSLPAARSLD